MRLRIIAILGALCFGGCGSSTDDFTLGVTFIDDSSTLDFGPKFLPSEVTYEVRRGSTEIVEQGDLTLVVNTIGPSTGWEHVTTLPAAGDYTIIITASNGTSLCIAAGDFSVPPRRLFIFLPCGEPLTLPDDFEKPEYVMILIGAVEEL